MPHRPACLAQQKTTTSWQLFSFTLKLNIKTSIWVALSYYKVSTVWVTCKKQCFQKTLKYADSKTLWRPLISHGMSFQSAAFATGPMNFLSEARNNFFKQFLSREVLTYWLELCHWVCEVTPNCKKKWKKRYLSSSCDKKSGYWIPTPNFIQSFFRTINIIT